MKTTTLNLIIVLAFTGCTLLNKETYVPHEKLIGVQSIYVGEDPDIARKPNQVNYKEDYFTVTIWEVVNACSQYDRNIAVSNDTIYLLKTLTSDVACASVVVDKTTFFISNTDGNKWVIVN